MALSIGDRIKWCATPRGSLVKMGDSVAWCRGEHGSWVNLFGNWLRALITILPWRRDYEDEVVVVALNVPADATTEHLRELAERFEVRDAVLRDASLWANLEPGEIEACAADLHRAGWRPGMTAEDAARLLADQASRARKIVDRDPVRTARLDVRVDEALGLGALGCGLHFDQDDP